MTHTILPIALGLALVAGPALAQGSAAAAAAARPSDTAPDAKTEATAMAAKQQAKDVDFDLTIPEAPGFAVIGLTPTKVIDPAASRQAIFDFIPFTDAKGNLKPGFAGTISPYFLLQRGLTLADYKDRTGWIERVVARLQFSVGFAEGDEGTTDKIGLGFSTDLLDNGDYRLNTELYDCADKAYLDIFDANFDAEVAAARMAFIKSQKKADGQLAEEYSDLNDDQKKALNNHLVQVRAAARNRHDTELMKTRGDEYNAARKTCQDKFKKDYLNQAALIVAGGVAWNTKTGRVGSEEFDGGSFWASYRQPLGVRKMHTKKVHTKKKAGAAAEEADAFQSGALLSVDGDDDEGGGVLPNYVTIFGRYDFDKKAEIPGGMQKFEQYAVAGVLGYVLTNGARLSAEGGYERLNYRGVGPLKDSGSEFWAFTAKYPLGDRFWLEAKGGASKSNPAAPDDKDAKVTFTIRWAPKT